MVEVFKTNVENFDQAKELIERILRSFPGYEANFDLEDCDRILRIKFKQGIVEPNLILNLLSEAGYTAEILSDEIVSDVII